LVCVPAQLLPPLLCSVSACNAGFDLFPVSASWFPALLLLRSLPLGVSL
jgi:hypothetical protein